MSMTDSFDRVWKRAYANERISQLVGEDVNPTPVPNFDEYEAITWCAEDTIQKLCEEEINEFL